MVNPSGWISTSSASSATQVRPTAPVLPGISGWTRTMLSPTRRLCLEAQLRQARMIVGPAALRPAEQALLFRNRQVVDAGMARAHQAALVERPVLVAVGAEPVAAVVAPLVGEAHGDAVVGKRPQLLDQPVLKFARPLALEERDDRRAAGEYLRPVPPAAVRRI